MREIYLETNDKLIYEIVKSFFLAAEKQLFANAKSNSFIVKTVGIQALFDLLKKLALKSIEASDFSSQFFETFLLEASSTDFSSESFKNASGSGRVQIRLSLEKSAGI